MAPNNKCNGLTPLMFLYTSIPVPIHFASVAWGLEFSQRLPKEDLYIEEHKRG